MAGSQFRLIYTPDPSSPTSYKLNASNPGQFYYNTFYVGSGPTTLTITLPYPFVTQGAVPIHVYSGVQSMISMGGQTCFVPGTELANSSTQVTLMSYSQQVFGSTTTITVNLPSLPSNFAYVNIHLDYGLKGTTGYSKGAQNQAMGATTTINDKVSYIFSDSLGGSATVQNENVFKRDPGIAGLVRNANTDPVPNVQVKIYDSSNKLQVTVYTDQDGWYMWQYKYTGKAAPFTVKLPAYNNLAQSVTLKSNAFVVVNFSVP